MRNMTRMGVTSTSIYSSVSDNSEDSESPWPLKVWARLEGQIRDERRSQKMPFSQINGGVGIENQKTNTFLE